MTERVSGEDVIVENATEDVIVESAEDVRIEGGSIEGELVIKNAQDVIVRQGGEVRVEQSEDVNVDSGTVEGDVTVENAQDVYEDDGVL
jgi:hypothetical protein